MLNFPIAATCVYVALMPPSASHAMGVALPQGCTVVNEHTHHAGFDVSYAMEIAFDDEADVEAVVQELALTPVTPKPFQDVITFVSLNPPPWWPAVDQLPAYERVIMAEERYWTLWVDRDRKRMYLERGRW